MLREILRKMSKDDSHVRLKSLEQVIQLGQDIVEDSEDKRKRSPLLSSTIGNAGAYNGNNSNKTDYLESSRGNVTGEVGNTSNYMQERYLTVLQCLVHQQLQSIISAVPNTWRTVCASPEHFYSSL